MLGVKTLRMLSFQKCRCLLILRPCLDKIHASLIEINAYVGAAMMVCIVALVGAVVYLAGNVKVFPYVVEVFNNERVRNVGAAI